MTFAYQIQWVSLEMAAARTDTLRNITFPVKEHTLEFAEHIVHITRSVYGYVCMLTVQTVPLVFATIESNGSDWL